MITYIYDGSFDGLLSSIYKAFYAKVKPKDIVSKKEFVENFLIKKEYIKTDLEKSKKVYQAIEKKISHETVKKVFFTYLSELPGAGILILRYLEEGFKIGRDINLKLADENVLKVDKIYRKVAKERHRLTGILRFNRIDKDVFYAQVEPDHNVVALLAPHFSERLKNEKFIIHDTKRNIGVFYSSGEWIIEDIEKEKTFLVKEQEEIYENLWRTYFDSISIKGKTNHRLQRKNIPVRYWKHLTEKK